MIPSVARLLKRTPQTALKYESDYRPFCEATFSTTKLEILCFFRQSTILAVPPPY